MSEGEARPSLVARASAFVRATRVLWLITLGGFAWRVVTIVAFTPTCPLPAIAPGSGVENLDQNPQVGCFAIRGDSLVHYLQGRFVAEGHGLASPGLWLQVGVLRPSGSKPPIYSTFLGVLYALGIHDATWQRILSAAVGALAIFLAGYLLTTLIGPRAGIIAALLVAVCPNLWINDGSLKNDGMVVPFVAVVLLLAYRMRRDPRPATVAAFGVAVALTALVRTEQSFLVLFVGLPVLWGAKQLTVRSRLTLWLLAVTTTALVLFPWVARNLVSFSQPTLMSVGGGALLLNASCDDTYYGDHIGSLSFRCYEGAPQQMLAEAFDKRHPVMDESVVDQRFMELAQPYVRSHLSRLPVVMAARVARLYQLYDPVGTVQYDAFFEDRGTWQSWAQLWFFYALIPFAVYGGVVLHRRRVPLSPLVGVLVAGAFTAAVSFGITRFRGPVELVLCLLAAAAVDALLARRGAARADAADDGRAPVPA